MEDLLTALGLAVAIEGALYALFPVGMKRMMIRILATPLGQIHNAGLIALILGVGMVWLVRG